MSFAPDWNNLSSGLIGAVLGAVASFAAATWTREQEIEHERREALERVRQRFLAVREACKIVLGSESSAESINAVMLALRAFWLEHPEQVSRNIQNAELFGCHLVQLDSIKPVEWDENMKQTIMQKVDATTFVQGCTCHGLPSIEKLLGDLR